jgi:xylulose-5-phosphate/fructose-6-phosphate phosphoketolase
MTSIDSIDGDRSDVAQPGDSVGAPLDDRQIQELERWWRTANYLSVGQIYLLDNPLLREPLRAEHVKPRLLGHWGTCPGINLTWAHLNRAIRERDLQAMYVVGPGHGGPAAVANAYLDGTYSEVYPDVSRDEAGLRRLFRQFSYPGGVPSHVAPETPGSIHEGGELGYALSHAFGAVFDNPDLVAVCMVGDGEAETGPAATGWHGTSFLNPARDGAVLPVLALNGYKIASPTVLARIPHAQLLALLRGYGWDPYVVAADLDADHAEVHQRMARVVESCLNDIDRIQTRARTGLDGARPTWPMIVLRTPKGWTGPREVDGVQVEGTWRSHQVPLTETRTNPGHLRQLEAWLRSYRPEELFDEFGSVQSDITDLAPRPARRMSASPHANGGILRQALALPDFRDYGVPVTAPGTTNAEATRVLGTWLRDVITANPTTFRLFGPDETASNRLQAVFEATDRLWVDERLPVDEHQGPDGRVLEVLSEHQCQGWLEGYLLTGRHGLFSCYEAFIHIVDSMVTRVSQFGVGQSVIWLGPT